MQRKYALDAMRGVAALAVVLYHAKKVLGLSVAPHGYLAVDLFYVLSGYVIAKSYDQRFERGLGTMTFAKIRALRFYPLYLLGLSIGVAQHLALIAAHTDHAPSPGELLLYIVAGLLFLPLPFANMFPLNVPSWSLFFELLVNVAYRATIGLWTRRNLAILLAVTAIMLVFAVVAKGDADIGASIHDLGGGAIRTIFSFAAGVLLTRVKLVVPRIPAQFLMIAVAVLLLMPKMDYWYDLLFVLVFSPLLVALGAQAIEHRTAIPAYAYLGAISFPIYAVHRPLLHLAESAAKLLHVPPYLLGIACIAGLLALCPLLTRWFDQPIAKRLIKRQTARASG